MIIMVKRGLPKKYAKMGFKKGWAAYRRSGSTKSTRRVSRMAQKTRRRTTRRSKFTGLAGQAVGIGAYILFESMIEPQFLRMANISNPLAINAIELLTGAWLAKKSGVLGSVGKAAVTVNLYQILQPYLSGKSSGAYSNMFN
jgi:hypothetical protein